MAVGQFIQDVCFSPAARMSMDVERRRSSDAVQTQAIRERSLRRAAFPYRLVQGNVEGCNGLVTASRLALLSLSVARCGAFYAITFNQ